MKKQAIFILSLIVLFGTFFFVNFNFKKEKEENIYAMENTKIEKENVDEKTLETSSTEEKTTPNTEIVLKKYYSRCGHTIQNKATIPDEIVNMKKEEVQNNYPNWTIEEFSKDEIVLYRELNSFCGEHYLLIEENGKINIYNVNENGEKTLKEETNLSVEYLTETDKITLKNGIMIYGTEELNKIIEDYEV